MKIRIAGMALFLCIPLVLYLYLAQPLGVLPSLGLGVLIMIGHRFLASPFSARHRPRRCLWCGRSIPIAQVSLALPVQGGKEISYKFCPPSSADCRVRWIGLHRLVLRHKHLIQFGIFIPVL
ncbi:MAG: hypothetical protein KJ927_19340, partial [Candidatus Eisenbacteria bacterium]|nr:hypothetical protein [Candidatus Eisenbacteria bacterium]